MNRFGKSSIFKSKMGKYIWERGDFSRLLYKRGLDYRGDLSAAIRLKPREVRALFRESGRRTLYIRNPYDFDCDTETRYWYVVRDRAMEIDEYPSKKDKQQIRRALKAYEYKRVDKEEMHRVGYRLFCENWQRFPETNRPTLMTKDEYTVYLQAQAASGVEFWVGYSTVTGEAAMCEEVYVSGKCAHEIVELLSYRYKQHYPTYGFNHVLANYYLRERGLRYVVAGARTATEHSNVQQFLLSKMGFRKAYCRLQVCLRFPFNVVALLLYPVRSLFTKGSNLHALMRLLEFTKQSK